MVYTTYRIKYRCLICPIRQLDHCFRDNIDQIFQITMVPYLVDYPVIGVASIAYYCCTRPPGSGLSLSLKFVH